MMSSFDINRFDKDSLVSDEWLSLLNNAYSDSSLTKRGLSSLLGYNVDNFSIDEIVQEYTTLNVNNLGFRENSKLDSDILNNSIWCFGCSWTFGIGVTKYNNWPELLKGNANRNTINFGVPASGPETTYRLLNEYISAGYKPESVCILGWFPGRVEVDGVCYTVHSVIDNVSIHKKLKQEILTNEYSLNAIKKIKKLLLENNIKSYYINIEELGKIDGGFSPLRNISDYIDLYIYGSDMLHPGFGTHLIIANMFSEKINNKLEWV